MRKVRCTMCGNEMWNYDNYCSHCGSSTLSAKSRSDKLDDIVDKQSYLFDRIVDRRSIELGSINTVLERHVLALNDEVAELQRELDWKWWTNNKNVDVEACKEELIDILHFDIQALIYLGCDAEEIHDLYLGKNKENHKRQEGKTDRDGYNVKDINEEYKNVDK